MRLFIAGWQGQVARSLVEAATRRDDIEACAMGRPALDLCEQPTILRALEQERPDIVINTAAYTAVDQAESEPEKAHQLNCEGAGRLASAAEALGVPIIHLSTDYVFDGIKPTAYDESDPTNPQSVYGRTKRDGEIAVSAANPKHLIVRTAWVHSPFGKNFVKTMLRLAQEKTELRVVADQTGSPTYAPHLADALLAMAAASIGNTATEWGTYHACGSGEATWHALAEAVFEAARKEVTVEAITTADYPTPAPRPANSRLDCSKLREVFGLELPAWQEGATDCVARLLEAS